MGQCDTSLTVNASGIKLFHWCVSIASYDVLHLVCTHFYAVRAGNGSYTQADEHALGVKAILCSRDALGGSALFSACERSD